MRFTSTKQSRAPLHWSCILVALAATSSCLSTNATDSTSESTSDDVETSSESGSNARDEDSGGSNGADTNAQASSDATTGSTSSASSSTSSATDTSTSTSTGTTFGSTGTSSSSTNQSAGDTTGTGDPSTGDDPDPITCPTNASSAGDTTIEVQIGSSTRSYILHVPPAYDGSRPVPLVVDFHPLSGSGQSERNASPYPGQTDPEGVITAFPSGLAGPSGGAWNVGPCCVANTDDVAFARALVADVQARACIDPQRVYAVGFSMGGGMSHYLACHAADLFAAVAPAAFDLLEENVEDCHPERPITVVSFRSTGDPIVPYMGGFSSVVSGMPITFLGAQATFEAWAERNQCNGSPSQDANGCSAYSDCAAGTEVVLCTRQGGGHDYGDAAIGWPILREHTLP